MKKCLTRSCFHLSVKWKCLTLLLLSFCLTQLARSAGVNGAKGPFGGIATFQGTITGTVTDGSGQGLQGITVSVVGTSLTTATDGAGKYAITAEVGDRLRFSGIGYATTEAEITGQQVDVVMAQEESALD